MTIRQIEHPWGYYAPSSVKAASNWLRSRIRSKRVKNYLLRWSLIPRVHDVSRFGLNFRCYAGDNHTENSVIAETQEPPELRQLLQTLKPGDVFLDIGANCGVFSLTAAKRIGGSGRVLAIEPNPVMLNRLRFNILANDLENITVVDAAVGESDGNAELYLSSRQHGLSTLLARDEWQAITVPVKTLLSLCREYGIERIDAVKIDIEGYEDRVILPFLRSAPKELWPRAILIETGCSHRWREDCIHHLQEMNFSAKWKGKKDALLLLDS